MALTACGSGDSASGSKRELSSDTRNGQGSTGGGQPAPDAVAPEKGRSAAPTGDSADESKRDVAPPDYLSTFALDVDTASYGYARRTLGDGMLPSPRTYAPRSSSTASGRGTNGRRAPASR